MQVIFDGSPLVEKFLELCWLAVWLCSFVKEFAGCLSCACGSGADCGNAVCFDVADKNGFVGYP